MAEKTKILHEAPQSFPLLLTVDSLGLHATVSTVHEGKENRLQPTLARLRDLFEQTEIQVIQWIKVETNIANALTKRNIVMYRKLNEVCVRHVLGRENFRAAKRNLSS